MVRIFRDTPAQPEAGVWPEGPAEADLALPFTLLVEMGEEAVTSLVVKGHEVQSRPLG